MAGGIDDEVGGDGAGESNGEKGRSTVTEQQLKSNKIRYQF